MKYLTLLFVNLLILCFLTNCTKVKKSAGITRKSPDEFQIINNPPLVIPPNFNLPPPDEITESKKLENDSELTKEILFGMEDSNSENNNKLSTVDVILDGSGANIVNNDIRDEVDEEFNNSLNTDSVFQVEWSNEQEVLDAVEESKRIRENIFNNQSILEGETPKKTIEVKKKRKKRFILF